MGTICQRVGKASTLTVLDNLSLMQQFVLRHATGSCVRVKGVGYPHSHYLRHPTLLPLYSREGEGVGGLLNKSLVSASFRCAASVANFRKVAPQLSPPTASMRSQVVC